MIDLVAKGGRMYMDGGGIEACLNNAKTERM